MNIAPPFGIDLGTTRSAAAVFLPGADAPTVATDDKGKLTLPSVIRSAGPQRWHVGGDAIDVDASSQAPLLESVKRFMGSVDPLPECDELEAHEASAIICSAISARMQSHLALAHPDLDMVCRDAVITVPAYFDAPQIEATRQAGELAGLRVAGLVQEPTAAAIYHTWKRDIGDGTFLVYDLGGGTFDISIIRTIFGEYQVLSIDGDNHLGGDDFDRRLADHFRSHLIDAGYDLSCDLESPSDRQRFQILRRLGRDIKEVLSSQPSVMVDEEQIFDDRSGRPVDLTLDVDRDKFEELIDDLLESTILGCQRALRSANARHDLEPEDVDGVFLVGGSTRVPAVAQRLMASIGQQIGIDEQALVCEEPETSVARGAALHAAAVAPLKFETQGGDTTIAITDLPCDNPDRRLIGYINGDFDPEPTSISFCEQRRTDLESLGNHPRFSIADFNIDELAPSGDSLVSTVLYRDDTPVFGPVQLWLPERPEGSRQAPTLALSNPAVLAKDITVEVVENDEPARHTLIERGTHLPTTARHKLVTGDRCGSLVLRLFQHRLPIHTLVLSLPEEISPGTPLELAVDVDQAMNLRAFGSIGDQRFHARIDRPATPRRWQWDEIESMLDRADHIETALWGGEARRFEAQRHSIRRGIEAAVTQDPHRLQILARRLQALLAEYGPKPERIPGRERLHTLLDTIRRLVFAADEQRLGRSRQDWDRQLGELAQEVDEAWEGDDDRRWNALADRIQALFESVAQDEFLFRQRDPERYATTVFDTTRRRLESLRRQIQQFPQAADGDARKLQKTELNRIDQSLNRLRRQLPSQPISPDEVSEIERVASSLEHLERRLNRVHVIGVPRRGESS